MIGVQSETKDIYGGGPQGGFLGILEFLSLSNDNAAQLSNLILPKTLTSVQLQPDIAELCPAMVT